jgi:hypothetical protein
MNTIENMPRGRNNLKYTPNNYFKTCNIHPIYIVTYICYRECDGDKLRADMRYDAELEDRVLVLVIRAKR